MPEGRLIKTLTGHESNVLSVAFSPDGRYLASGSADNTIKLWEMPTSPPSFLTVKAKFDDTSTGANGLLDSGEEANIIFKISNTGEGPALGVKLKISADNKYVSIPEEFYFALNIPPNTTKEVLLPVSASMDAKNGIANITIETKEFNGYDAQTVRFNLTVHQIEPPALEIAELKNIKINDQTPVIPKAATEEVKRKLKELSFIKGNGNGIIENEEVVQLIIPVQNIGKGDAYGVQMATEIYPECVEISGENKLGNIKPNETKEIKLVLYVPRRIVEEKKTIDVKLSLRDIRKAIPVFGREISLPYEERKPKIDFYSYKISDGGTATKSRGNRNGLIEQGEIIEFEVVFENSGKFEAKNLDVELFTDKQGVIINQGKASLGNVQAGKRSKANFLFAVQRAATAGNFPLTFEFSEADFPLEDRIVNLEILSQGIAEIKIERVIPKVGDKIWVGTDLENAGRVYDLLRDPLNADIVYLATKKSGVLKSTNNGIDWKVSNQGLGDLFILCLAMGKNDSQVLYAGSDRKGVFKSKDGGTTWKASNGGISIISEGVFPCIQCITVDTPEEDIIYVGTKDRGLYKSTNGGGDWVFISGLPSKDVRCITLNPKFQNIVYAGLGSGGLYRSIDAGKTWNVLFETNLTDDIANAILSIAIDPTNPDTIYFARGSGGIVKTTDGGSIWLPINKGLPSDLMIKGEPLSIYSLEIDPTNPSVLYATSRGGKIYVTRNSGKDWQEYNYGVADTEKANIQFVSVDPSGKAFLGGENQIFELQQIKEKRTISTVNFDYNSDKIKKEAFPDLDAVVALLQQDISTKAVIEGHTDNIGSDEYNLDLSSRRANSVRDYFVQKDISLSRLSSCGYGKSMPVSKNETEEGRTKNRRVEILIVGR
jgi:outer membrane protein OmpA-like peptidoglycan-associated protein